MRICCIIKPHAIEHADAIIAVIEEQGACVRRREEILYTTPLVHALYDHMDADARDAITERLCGKPGIALLIEVASVDRMLDIAGRHSNPALCDSGSIRARFARDATEERMGTARWWENALHRPIDEREAERDLELVFP